MGLEVPHQPEINPLNLNALHFYRSNLRLAVVLLLEKEEESSIVGYPVTACVSFPLFLSPPSFPSTAKMEQHTKATEPGLLAPNSRIIVAARAAEKQTASLLREVATQESEAAGALSGRGVPRKQASGGPLRASEQATPCGLNRFVLLVVHALYVAVSARVLFGWPHLSNMLLHDGAYLWRCEGEPLVDGKRYACARQDSSIQMLFTLGIGVSFCCSLAAGALLDWGGPKLSACLGQLLTTIGWVLLGIASEERQVYVLAVVFIAMGADAGYLPSMNIANLFPGYESLVIVGVCAAMSASFSVTSIMDAAWRAKPDLSFQSICLMYAGLGPGLCFVVAAVAMPASQYKSQEELTLAYARERESSAVRSSTEAEAEAAGESSSKQHSKEENNSFFTQLGTSHFLLFFVYWPLNALFYNFYLTSAENLFGRNINNLIGLLGPVSMVPSIVLGFVADRWGVMSLVLFVISSGVCMYSFALMPFAAAPCISAVFSCLYVSNFSGQLYAYVGDTFRSTDFGRLVGIISITGGLTGLLRIPLNDELTLQVFEGNYRYTCALMLGVAILCLVLAVWLTVIKRRQQKAYVTEEELQLQLERAAALKAPEETQLAVRADGPDHWA
ncbi:hypothetical protein Esti_002316 [Eimeria stiedai]